MQVGLLFLIDKDDVLTGDSNRVVYIMQNYPESQPQTKIYILTLRIRYTMLI